MRELPLLIACVADDFTGASDAASFLVSRGCPTMLMNGISKSAGIPKDCMAVVIALKTRNAPVKQAVHDTLAAFSFLEKCGAKQFYLKYCSTFDSTPEGNIGPTTDAIMDEYDIPYTLLCPSLPVNKRVVRDGRLYVDGIPLSEGHMRNHPLNPMWHSDIAVLMAPQSKYPCLILSAEQMRRPKNELLACVQDRATKGRFYAIPDYEVETEGRRIAEAFGDLRLITGGSGLLAHLVDRHLKQENGLANATLFDDKIPGKGIALSGSCSKATREQIRSYCENGGAVLAIDSKKLLDGSQTIEEIWSFVQKNRESLIYSAGVESDNASRREEEPEQASKALENALSALGRLAFESGYTRIIVAGGETSGAVCVELGFHAFRIGRSVAPGVPVMIPAENSGIRIVLKSGNFGQADFFHRAFEQTRG